MKLLQSKYSIYFYIFFIVELIFLAYMFQSNQPFMQISPDGKLYYNLAENLVRGNGLIDTVRIEDIIVPPLFSLILVPFVFIFNDPVAFIVFQYILFGINSVLLFYFVEILFHSRLPAIVTSILYVLHPVIIMNGPQYLLTETIFITFIIIVSILSVKWLRNPSNIKTFAFLITILSISLLFRPHLLYVFLILSVLLLAFIVKKQIKFIAIVMFIIPVILLTLNGTHNYITHNEFVLLENYSGQNMYIANNPETEVAFYSSGRLEEFVGKEYFEYKNLSLGKRSEILKDKAVSYIMSHPLDTIERMIKKSLLFFKGISSLDTILLVSSIIGFLLAFIFNKKNRLIHGYFLFYILGFVGLTSLGLLVGKQRYRAPIAPIYLIYSGYFVYWLFLTIKRKANLKVLSQE
ncbi:hypothetical protein [Aquibacillus rhizosphaerae]|uniref:Glycosyltransferase RgtA/B/C/D-like domain-containing protein n=1 Tax=Aquibacillus rhizosphaerae TaxID=3051431 RepID=A0ABT7KZX2_9BACI|nr:hypothetical protein [Aquibacillus sp. LR5S19]MDL4839109.1 hypothetical protein [Aquibacillus sp. LR5S19]